MAPKTKEMTSSGVQPKEKLSVPKVEEKLTVLSLLRRSMFAESTLWTLVGILKSNVDYIGFSS